MLSRRRFLQVGLAGAALLAAARLLDRAPGTTRFHVLDESSAGLIAALAPAVLAGGLPTESAPRTAAIQAVVAAFDQAVAGMSPAVQSEIGDLLSLLCFPPARVALAGLWPAWSEADVQSIAAFLQRWRVSRFDLFHAGYQALTQLLQAAWYGNPLAWGALGYVGPPKLPA